MGAVPARYGADWRSGRLLEPHWNAVDAGMCSVVQAYDASLQAEGGPEEMSRSIHTAKRLPNLWVPVASMICRLVKRVLCFVQ